MVEKQAKILFLSGVDFKEKSIQVIRKTPEAYRDAGWEVHYAVGRDNSRAGDYFYERIINPPGIQIHRFVIPFASLHALFKLSVWQAFWFRIRTWLMILRLAIIAVKLSRTHKFNIIYGYEIPGVLAVRIVRALGFYKRSKFVTRFQGVLFVKEWLRKNQAFRKFTNVDALMALRTKADLVVMTNDGSQGVQVLAKLRSPNKNILFVTNGVDVPVFDSHMLQQAIDNYYDKRGKGHWYFLSVSRLDNHKRIDRSLRLLAVLVNEFKFINFTFTIIGGGYERQFLEELTSELKLNNFVRFLGPMHFDLVKYHFSLSDVFFSMYTSTNVGNPLLEAIRHNILIVTLANGDTGEWIEHGVNGLIFPVNDDADLKADDYLRMANELKSVLQQPVVYSRMKSNLKLLETTKIWTWQERMRFEVDQVSKLLLG